MRGLGGRRFKVMRVSTQWDKDVNIDLVATHLTDKVAENWRRRNHERPIRVGDCRCRRGVFRVTAARGEKSQN